MAAVIPTLMLYSYGTIHNVFSGFYLFSIIISAFVLNVRISIFFAGVSLIGLATVAYLEQLGRLSEHIFTNPLQQALIFTLIIALTIEIFRLENINRNQLKSTLKQLNIELGERKRVEEKLSYTSLHDDLTKLPNRNLLKTSIDISLENFQDDSTRQFALIYLDLDRFKIINDSLGHAVGDQVLIEFSNTIDSFLGDTDTAARLGGDEFVILLNDISDVCDATNFANRILIHLNTPILFNDKSLSIGTSIGIVMSHYKYSSANEMLRDGDIAMYLSKENGKHRYTIFDDVIHQNTIDRLALENDFHLALQNQEFTVHYQPIMRLIDNSLSGFEALARWEHPQKGFINPETFISIAEDNSMISELSLYIIEKAMKQFVNWKHNEILSSEVYLSVNISPQCLDMPSFTKNLIDLINIQGFNPYYLMVEITESVLMSNLQQNIQELCHLQALGIQISIDDFGTGYSSLSYLHQLPINNIKIDKSFIMEMHNHIKNQCIVETLITLGKSLDLQLIAEGIENAEHLDRLLELECELGQGFYFSKPLSSEDVLSYCNNLKKNYHLPSKHKNSSKVVHN